MDEDGGRISADTVLGSSEDGTGDRVATAYNLVRMANLSLCERPRAVQSV